MTQDYTVPGAFAAFLTAAAVLISTPAFAEGDKGVICASGKAVNHASQCGGPVMSQGQHQGQHQGQSQGQTATGGNVIVTQRGVRIAPPAIAAPIPGYGPANCFGDVNASGQLSLAWSSLIGGGSASASKASNVCAIYHIAGPVAAMEYLQRMDRNAPRSVVMPGATRVTCPASHPVYVEGRGCRK